MAAIQLISERWLQGKKTDLLHAAASCKVELQAEIDEAEKHLAAKNAVIELAAKQKFRRNDYEGKCVKTGETVKPSQGFVQKAENGKWLTYSFAAVQEIVGYKFEG